MNGDTNDAGSKIVELYAAADAIEAHAIANSLRDEGINVQVVGDLLQTAHGGLPFGAATSPRIWVAQADHQRAEQLLDAWKAHRDGPTSRRSVGSFQTSIRMLLVNLTILAVIFALAHVGRPESPWTVFTFFASWLIFGNLMVMAYFRKKRSRE